MLRKTLVASFLLLANAAFVAQAQDVFVAPGALSTSQSLVAYTANPLAQITGLTAGPGAFQVLAAAGKFYIIQNSGSVSVTDGAFATVRSIGSFTQAPTGAAVTPDGKRLAVAAGTLHIFDTGSDTELVSTSGINVGSGVNLLYVVAGLDGKALFTAGTTSTGSQLNAIDPASLNVTGTLAIRGTVTGLAVGPNGLIYVSTQNPSQIVEVNPGTLTLTSGGTILLNAAPGSLVFTPDGQYAMVANKTTTGSVASLISLSSHSILNGIPFSSVGVGIDNLQIIGINTVAAFASGNQSLYEIIIGPSGILNIVAFPIGGLSTGVTAIAASNEVPGGSISVPSALFISSAGTLYRADLASGNTTQASIPNAVNVGVLSFASQAVTGTLPTTLITYGGSQSVAPGATSLPLVVQALDGAGRPLSGVTVTFSASPTTAAVSPTAVTTGSNGNAVTYLTAPSTAGTVQVTASGGTKTANFNITVAGATPGAASGMRIVAGQGQMLPEGVSTANSANGGPGSPLTVLVMDSNGNPVSGATVTFLITQGQGGVVSGGVSGQTATVTADSNGKASVDFLAPIIGSPIGSTGGFAQTTITATSGSSTATFYITTTPGLEVTIGSPTTRLITPNPGSTLTGQATTTLPGAVVVQVTSALGVPVPNVGVILSNGGLDPTLFPSATCNDPNGTGVLTDQTGTATCDLVFGSRIGSGSISAVVGYSSTANPFTIVVTPGPPAKVNIKQGNNQSGTPGQTLPFALLVQVTDAGGNVLPGVAVSWQVVTSGTVTLKNVISTTDSNGQASALATLGNVAGPQQVTVTSGTATATFTLTVNIAAAGIQKVSGDNQTAQIGGQFSSPLVVKVVDSKGAAVQGAQVTFAVTTGSATLGSPNANTDTTGQASTTVTAGTSAGAITVTASTSGLSTSFSLTSILPGPANLVIYNGPNFASGFSINTISPGSIATITGTGLATGVQGLVSANNIIGPLPTTLPSVPNLKVTFGGVAAPIYYVLNSNGQEQVTVQVPFEVQPGSVSVVVNGAGGGSSSVNVTVQAFAPGAFTTTYGNQMVAVAQRPDGSYVSPSNPAHPGENVRFYVTGLGQVTPATGTGLGGVPGQKVNAQVAVGINTSSGSSASASGVKLVAAEYAPGLAGVYAVTVQLPADTLTGPAQLFAMIVFDSQNNTYFMQSVPIPIQ